jgi:hypothetical protein
VAWRRRRGALQAPRLLLGQRELPALPALLALLALLAPQESLRPPMAVRPLGFRHTISPEKSGNPSMKPSTLPS